MIISDFFLSIKNVLNYNKIKPEEKNFVFFSENKNYQNFYINLINSITFSGNKIVYISCDRNDFIENSNVINILLPSFVIRTFFLSIISCKFFFFTTTDLGFNEIKKSKNCHKYVYIFHSHISCHIQYNEKAFFNYDIFCCNNEFQHREINKIIKKYNLKNKILWKTGYLYGDFLSKLSNEKNNFTNNNILIAPTWYKDKKGLFDNGLETLLKMLIHKKYNITLRLHPEHLKRSKNKINVILNAFKSDEIKLEKNISSIDSLFEASYLITDYSGIGIEFIYYFKKPTIYFDVPKKIHNTNYEIISETSFEEEVKKKFGTIFSNDDISNFDLIIEKAKKNFEVSKKEIQNYFEKNLYNIGNSDKNIINELKNYKI